MSEFLAEDLDDGQRVVLVKNIDGTTLSNSELLAEVVVDLGDGTLQRCIAVKAVNGGGGGSSTLDGLTDVDLQSLEDGQILVYNNTTGKWENKVQAVDLEYNEGTLTI